MLGSHFYYEYLFKVRLHCSQAGYLLFGCQHKGDIKTFCRPVFYNVFIKTVMFLYCFPHQFVINSLCLPVLLLRELHLFKQQASAFSLFVMIPMLILISVDFPDLSRNFILFPSFFLLRSMFASFAFLARTKL